MAAIFVTRILRRESAGRNKILDGGCGTGVQALYLARRSPSSFVHGYDSSADAIVRANERKQKHGLSNAFFSVASHDVFQPPYKLDMIYTASSLVADSEVPQDAYSPIIAVHDIVKKRLSRFREMLSPKGIYIMEWSALSEANAIFETLAEECGLKSIGGEQGETYEGANGQLLFPSALVFERR